ncbi:MAG TPA: sigma 54-interacting transcriptional regulator [Kofleriaceae bacterium]|nr:sigma 54-interacting transcriptional regulator [Kofleriaceae bacterium]
MDVGELARVAEVVLGNPFETVAGREEAHAAVQAARARGTATLEDLARKGQHKVARRLLVAFVVDELAHEAVASFLDPRQCPERIFSELRLSREAVREVTASAARCAASLHHIAGTSQAIARVRAAVWRACHGESVYDAISMRPLIREQNVLVLGETGTGKELVAQAIAASDPDPDRVQVLNAAAIPEPLLESELFGHKKGAFSGSVGDREGKISAADGGTLFLDELADLPPVLQAKLLRVIDDDVVTPLGANQGKKVDVRYVSATSQPLHAMVERGAFRRDLFERLAGITIVLPPLRERLEDLRPIAERMFEQQSAPMARSGASTANVGRLIVHQARFLAWLDSDEARARPWNGNVRELQTTLRRWLLGFRETPATTVEPTADATKAQSQPQGLARVVDGAATLREVEDWYILHVLDKVEQHQRRAADVLGIDRGTLARRLRQIDGTDDER